MLVLGLRLLLLFRDTAEAGSRSLDLRENSRAEGSQGSGLNPNPIRVFVYSHSCN